jgi:hypothetical protein
VNQETRKGEFLAPPFSFAPPVRQGTYDISCHVVVSQWAKTGLRDTTSDKVDLGDNTLMVVSRIAKISLNPRQLIKKFFATHVGHVKGG